MVDSLIYPVAYIFLDQYTRSSAITYKNKGKDLLRCLHIIKCASIDYNPKMRAKLAFINCRISQEETTIHFLSIFFFVKSKL